LKKYTDKLKNNSNSGQPPFTDSEERTKGNLRPTSQIF